MLSSPRRSPKPLVHLLVLAVVVALGATPFATASAVEAYPSLEQGTAMPWRYETTLRYMDLAGVSRDYVMHSRRQSDEAAPGTYSVVRVSDGEALTLDPAAIAGGRDPRLVDHFYVAVTHKPASGDGLDRLLVHDVETGTTTTIDLSGHDRYVRGDDQWALVTDTGATSGDLAYSFVHADGRTVAVPALTGRTVRWASGDSTRLYVDTDPGAFEVDPQTGAATELTLPGDGGWPPKLWQATPDVLVGYEIVYVGGKSVHRFTTVDRGTGEVTGQTDVPEDHRIERFLPYGDRIAAFYRYGSISNPQGGTDFRYDLRPVDMATGVLQDPVATDLLNASGMGDGRVAVTVGDVPTGRLAVIADGSPEHPVALLPQIGYPSLDVGLSGGTVVTSFSGQNGLWTTADDGSGEWQATYPDSTPADDWERNFSVGGDTVLTELPSTDSGDTDHFRVAWPGGHRDFEASAFGGPSLSRDGRYVQLRAPGGSYRAEVQDTRTGAVVASWTDPDKKVQLDGSTMWTGPTVDGALTGVDLTGQQPDRTVTVPASCNGRVPEIESIRGRFALTHCSGRTLVDLSGVMPPWKVPSGPDHITLGDRFVAWIDRSQTSVITLRVADFTAEHTTKAYGPLRGQTYPPGPDFAADTTDRPDLVYLDSRSRVRKVHLDWLGEAPLTRPDKTPPVVTRAPELAPLVRSTTPVTLTPTWTYQEPEAVPHEPQSGLATTDVRWRPYPGTAAWTQPAEWATQPAASVRVTLKPGEGRCFQSRARDKVDNTTAWSAAVCSYVDGAAPVLQRATGSPRFVPQVSASVRYRYGARDDNRVASYDVAVRTARRGERLGAWTMLRTRTTATAVALQSGPGTERCFRFRARDAAGNLSAWSPARCSVLPIDSTRIQMRGTTYRASSIAIGGSYSQLNGRGTNATLYGQTGRTVALWVITGPTGGEVDVYVAGRRLSRVNLKSPTQRRKIITLTAPRPWTGAVRVVSVTNRRGGIDAIAVER